MRRPASRRGRGVTLIEAVLYIAIALALIVGGLVFYQQAVTASRVNSAARSLAMLIVEARIIARDSGQVVLVDDQMERVLLAQGSVPADLIDMTRPEGQRIRTPWGSRFSVELIDSGGTAVIEANVEGLPVAACARLASSDASGRNTFTTNIVTIWIYDSSVLDPPMAVGRGLGPRQAGTSCRQGDVNGDGLVAVGFMLRVAD